MIFARKVALGIQKAIPCKKWEQWFWASKFLMPIFTWCPCKREADLLNFNHKLKLSPEEFKEIREKIAAEIKCLAEIRLFYRKEKKTLRFISEDKERGCLK
jgi:histidine triad (HIT) family protein